MNPDEMRVVRAEIAARIDVLHEEHNRLYGHIDAIETELETLRRRLDEIEGRT